MPTIFNNKKYQSRIYFICSFNIFCHRNKTNNKNMKTEKIMWNDYTEKLPPPHYLDPKSEIVIEYDNETIKMTGKCLFPSEDPTLKQRGHVNHFHVIMLIDVMYALNVLWNGARLAKEKLGWEKMLAITTKSKITQKFKLDTPYAFQAEAKKAKMGIWKVTLYIKDQGKTIAEVETLAQVK